MIFVPAYVVFIALVSLMAMAVVCVTFWKRLKLFDLEADRLVNEKFDESYNAALYLRLLIGQTGGWKVRIEPGVGHAVVSLDGVNVLLEYSMDFESRLMYDVPYWPFKMSDLPKPLDRISDERLADYLAKTRGLLGGSAGRGGEQTPGVFRPE